MSAPTTLTFGKHNGRTIEDVFAEDPSYCRWILAGHFDDTPAEITQFLESKFDDGDLSYIMRWGRHRGRSLKQIAASHPSYIQWLKKSNFVLTTCPRLTAELQAFP